MLVLLTAINDLSSLGRIIVLEECATPGSTVAYDSVELVETADDRREVRNGDGEVFFALHDRDDDLCFQRGAAVDERLNFALSLLGTGKKGHGLAEGDWISYTVMEDRVAAVDQAFVLLKQLRDVAGIQGDVLPLAAEILELARRWRTVRQAIYDADNSAWVSMRAAVNVEAQEEALVSDFNAFNGAREVDGHPLRLKRESDPRGAAITVQFRGEQPRTLGLVGLPMSWLPHVAAPARPSRRVAKAAPAQVGAPSTTRIPEDVAQALAAARCEGMNLRLSGQLDPKLYAKVDKALKGMGAKWVSAKNAHVFKVEAAPVIAAALGTGEIVTDKDWEFFRTPLAIVQKMLSKVTLRQGMKAGEPNGGDGAIALELAKVLGRENVQCFELMPRNAATLAELGFPVVEGDFLAQAPSPRFDVICMNPPFGNLADTLHIEHAAKFLKPGGELVAICSPSWQIRSSARAIAFREWLASLDADIEPLPAGAFRESGTETATLMLTIRMPAAPAAVVKSQERAEVSAPVRDQLDLFAEAA